MKISKKLIVVLIIASVIPAVIGRLSEWQKGVYKNNYELFESLLINMLFSVVVTLTISWVIISILNYLNEKVPWNDKLLNRLAIEILATVPVAVLLGYAFGNLIFWLHPYKTNSYAEFVFNFLIISIIMNFVLVAITDWFHFFNKWKESLLENEKAITQNAILEREKLQKQYEVLKNQVNPHFLFNSLNVLSSIVRTHPEKSERFVEEFSSLYRYILDQSEQELVPLSSEIEICESYLFLQKIRFEDRVVCSIDIKDQEMDGCFVFPLSVQTLLENCFKHNKSSRDNQLQIKVCIENDHIVIENNIQSRNDHIRSTGIGHKNLEMHYAHYNKYPMFKSEDGRYVCKLPLFNSLDPNQHLKE